MPVSTAAGRAPTIMGSVTGSAGRLKAVDAPAAPPTRVEVRLPLATAGALVGIAGLAVALILPHSAAEAGSTGVYVSSEYRLLLLVGSLETAGFAGVLGALTLLRPDSRAAQPILFVVVALGVLTGIGTTLVLADYIRALP